VEAFVKDWQDDVVAAAEDGVKDLRGEGEVVGSGLAAVGEEFVVGMVCGETELVVAAEVEVVDAQDCNVEGVRRRAEGGGEVVGDCGFSRALWAAEGDYSGGFGAGFWWWETRGGEEVEDV